MEYVAAGWRRQWAALGKEILRRKRDYEKGALSFPITLDNVTTFYCPNKKDCETGGEMMNHLVFIMFNSINKGHTAACSTHSKPHGPGSAGTAEPAEHPGAPRDPAHQVRLRLLSTDPNDFNTNNTVFCCNVLYQMNYLRHFLSNIWNF